MTSTVIVNLLGSSSERQLRVNAQLQGQELFDLLASQYTLHEKAYFGICFHDKECGGLDTWLQLERRVSEQLPKSKTPLVLSFGVRYFVQDLAELREETTRKLFFWQALQLYSTGRLGCESDEAIRLAALALRVTEGDFLSESATRHHLDSKKLIPDEVLVAQGSSLEACADKVSRVYKQLQGMSASEALTQFMTLIERQPRYGIHYYNIKDTKGVPWMIGVSLDGVRLFYYSDPVKPRRVCPWKSIIDCSFSKNKFILETEVVQKQSVSGKTELVKQGSSDSGGTTVFTKGGKPARSSDGSYDGEGSEVLEFTTHSVKYSMAILDMIKTQHEFHKRWLEQKKEKLLPPPGQVVIREYSDPSQLMQQRSQPSLLLNPNAPTLKSSPVISRSSSMSNPLDNLGRPGSITTGLGNTTDISTLESLEQRRKQILAELGRKKALLAKLEREEKEYLTGAHRRKPTIGQVMRRTEGLEISSTSSAAPNTGNSISGPGGSVQTMTTASTSSPAPTPTIFSDIAESDRSVSPTSQRNGQQSRRGSSVLETVEKYANKVTLLETLSSKPSFFDEDAAEDEEGGGGGRTTSRSRVFTNSIDKGKQSEVGEYVESPLGIPVSPSMSLNSEPSTFFPPNVNNSTNSNSNSNSLKGGGGGGRVTEI